jgi:hypothetical protein
MQQVQQEVVSGQGYSNESKLIYIAVQNYRNYVQIFPGDE